MAKLNNIIKLPSKEAYETLLTTGSYKCKVNGVETTLTYDENTIYMTPEEVATAEDPGIVLIATNADIEEGTNESKVVTVKQMRDAINNYSSGSSEVIMRKWEA